MAYLGPMPLQTARKWAHLAAIPTALSLVCHFCNISEIANWALIIGYPIFLALTKKDIAIKNSMHRFSLAKAVAIIIASYAIYFARFSNPLYTEMTFVYAGISFMLKVNIFIAVLFENELGRPWTWMNAIAGILITAAIPNYQNMYVSDNGAQKMLVWPALSMPWIAAYTLWNLTFVYNYFDMQAMNHVAVLSVPLFANLIMPGTWLQFRCYSLLAWILYYASKNEFIDQLSIKIPHFNWLHYMASISSLVCAALLVLQTACNNHCIS